MSDSYPLKPFRIRNQQLLARIINEYPLATVISGGKKNREISLLPLMLESSEDGCLRLIGHLDRNNPHARLLVSGAPVSVVFQGPNAYVSPDLYDDPQLPGWLYVMVKGHGVVTDIPGEDSLASMLSTATDQFGTPEQSFELDVSDPRIDQFIGGIVAFRISLDEFSGIAKLAQDKGPRHAEIASRFLAGTQNPSPQPLFTEILKEMTVSL